MWSGHIEGNDFERIPIAHLIALCSVVLRLRRGTFTIVAGVVHEHKSGHPHDAYRIACACVLGWT